MTGLKILKLTWIDVMSLNTSLVFPDELDDIKPCKAHIIGFLFREDKDNYWLAKEVWETGQGKYIHVVPKKYVIRKEVFLSE